MPSYHRSDLSGIDWSYLAWLVLVYCVVGRHVYEELVKQPFSFVSQGRRSLSSRSRWAIASACRSRGPRNMADCFTVDSRVCRPSGASSQAWCLKRMGTSAEWLLLDDGGEVRARRKARGERWVVVVSQDSGKGVGERTSCCITLCREYVSRARSLQDFFHSESPQSSRQSRTKLYEAF